VALPGTMKNLTDLLLTERGERNAQRLGEGFSGIAFSGPP